MRSNASTSFSGLDSVLPATRSLGLGRIQDWIAAPHERIDPFCLCSGLLDPLFCLGGEFAPLAGAVFDRRDELAQAVGSLQPAYVAKQGAQVATFFVARPDLGFVLGERFLIGPSPAPLVLLFGALRFGQADDGSDDAAQARIDETTFRVVPLPRRPSTPVSS